MGFGTYQTGTTDGTDGTTSSGHPGAGGYTVGVAGLSDSVVAANNAYNDSLNNSNNGDNGNDGGNDNNNSFTNNLTNNIEAMSKYLRNSMPVRVLDALFGKFGGHEGKTYWESQRDAFGSPADRMQFEIDNPRPVLDQFTYQKTAEQKYKDLSAEEATLKKPDGIIQSTWDSFAIATKRVLQAGENGNVGGGYTPVAAGGSGQGDGSNAVTRTDENGDTRVVGRYTNDTAQRGSNTAVYGDDYLKAIPDSYKINNLYKQILGREVGSAGLGYYGPKLADGSMTELQLKESLLASNEYKNSGATASAPLSAPITSPSASNSVATSYGNSSNAGRQWTSGVFANNNGGGYTDGGVDTGVVDTGDNSVLNGLYQDVFGRDVGPDGIAAYKSMLDDGSMKPEDLRAILMASAEKANQVETVTPATVVTGPLDSSNSNQLSVVNPYREQLNKSYLSNFGREIGDAGLDYYTTQLDSGNQDMNQVLADLSYEKNPEKMRWEEKKALAETAGPLSLIGTTGANTAAATTAGAA